MFSEFELHLHNLSYGYPDHQKVVIIQRPKKAVEKKYFLENLDIDVPTKPAGRHTRSKQNLSTQ